MYVGATSGIGRPARSNRAAIGLVTIRTANASGASRSARSPTTARGLDRQRTTRLVIRARPRARQQPGVEHGTVEPPRGRRERRRGRGRSPPPAPSPPPASRRWARRTGTRSCPSSMISRAPPRAKATGGRPAAWTSGRVIPKSSIPGTSSAIQRAIALRTVSSGRRPWNRTVWPASARRSRLVRSVADDVEWQIEPGRRLDREVEALVAPEARDDEESAGALVGRFEEGGLDRRVDRPSIAVVDVAGSAPPCSASSRCTCRPGGRRPGRSVGRSRAPGRRAARGSAAGGSTRRSPTGNAAASGSTRHGRRPPGGRTWCANAVVLDRTISASSRRIRPNAVGRSGREGRQRHPAREDALQRRGPDP